MSIFYNESNDRVENLNNWWFPKDTRFVIHLQRMFCGMIYKHFLNQHCLGVRSLLDV